MTETEIAIEETKTQPESRTARFAQWLMDRDAKREEKESNLEGLMKFNICLLYTSPSPRDRQKSRMPSSA